MKVSIFLLVALSLLALAVAFPMEDEKPASEAAEAVDFNADEGGAGEAEEGDEKRFGHRPHHRPVHRPIHGGGFGGGAIGGFGGGFGPIRG